MELNLIEMDIKSAAALKWQIGKTAHRQNGEGAFIGDPLVKLFEKMLDAINYCTEIERRSQLPPLVLQHWRGEFEAIAEHIQARFRLFPNEKIDPDAHLGAVRP